MAPSRQGGVGKVGHCAEDAVQGVPGLAFEAMGLSGPLVALAL